METSFLDKLQIFQNDFIQLTLNSPFYQSFGLLVVFIYAATPSIVPIPNEAFWVPIYQQVPIIDQQTFLAKIVILLGVSGFLGDSAIYFAAKHGVKYFRKDDKKAELKMTHWLHRYKHWIFIASPSAWFLPSVPEIVLIGAAVKNLKYTSFWHYLLLGNVIRNAWGVALIASGINFLEVFNII